MPLSAGSLTCNNSLLPEKPSGLAFVVAPDIGMFRDSSAVLTYNLSGRRCLDFLTLTTVAKESISSGAFFLKRPVTVNSGSIADFSFILDGLTENDTVVEISCIVKKSSGIEAPVTGDTKILHIRHVPPAESFIAYYDPSSGSIRVRVPDTGAENLRVTIYDLTGRARILRKVVSDFETIDGSALGSGVYIAEISFLIKGKLFRHTSKIIKP